VTDDPVDLNEHRGMADQKAIDVRLRRHHQLQADQAALQRRQEELNRPILAAPPEAWPEAAASARNHVQLSASGAAAQDPSPKELIAHVLDDLTRL
jgi:hypothetical protein